MSKIYSIALRALIQIKNKINVVVVGANDGKINDPIYNFNIEKSDKSIVCLIEPNTALLPYLKENYSSHPCYKIANCAVGKDGILSLYAIKEDFWESFQPPYAKRWPVYRAATGITSASREHHTLAIDSRTKVLCVYLNGIVMFSIWVQRLLRISNVGKN